MVPATGLLPIIDLATGGHLHAPVTLTITRVSSIESHRTVRKRCWTARREVRAISAAEDGESTVEEISAIKRVIGIETFATVHLFIDLIQIIGIGDVVIKRLS